MPRARSSDSSPVGIASTRTCAPSSPIRMTVPLPNSRSICVSAPCSAASRADAALSLLLMNGPSFSGRTEKLGPGPDGNSSAWQQKRDKAVHRAEIGSPHERANTVRIGDLQLDRPVDDRPGRREGLLRRALRLAGHGYAG